MADEEINKEEMKKEMEEEQAEEFVMSDEEQEDAKKSGFNPFWSTKDMEHDKLYKFKIVSDKIIVKDIEDKFEGKPTSRMVFSMENLESGMTFDLACSKNPNKQGNYGSLTQAVRKLYALTNGNVKDRYISIVKRQYNHPTYGDTDSFTINLISAEPDVPQTAEAA